MSFQVLVDCKAVPFEARQAFGTSPKPISSEQTMWRAAAARMTLDAVGYTNYSLKDHGEYREHLKATGEAQKWFRECYDDVRLVFELAGVEHEEVCAAILQHIQENT